MNVYVPIKTLIAANVTANGLLSGRVYAGVLPQSPTYPAAVVNMIGLRNTNSKTSAGDLQHISVQIDVYGATVESVSATSAAIKTAIEYQTSGSVQHIEFTGLRDGFTEKAELFRKINEYDLAWQ